MVISYAITVCNEFVEIQQLIPFLLKHKRPQDHIVVLYDQAHGDEEVETYLRSHSVEDQFLWFPGNFNGDFSAWKNKLQEYCIGDYIVNIDADEMPHENFMHTIPLIIENNPTIDLFQVARVNTVEGLTQDYIKKWGWRVDGDGWVNFPDWQGRVYKNQPHIKWKNPVHEVIEGATEWGPLPAMEEYSFYHHKTIAKQVKQNNYYNTL